MSPINSLIFGIAIVSEVIATSALKASNGSITLRWIPVGVAYAIWSGVGIVLVSIIGWLVYGQKLNWPTVIGMALIIAGVAVVNLSSSSTLHS